MNIQSFVVCGTLLLFLTVAYGQGSYQRTRDGQTLVWRDAPARGDEATWSGKRDENGYATGSGVLTWYKSEPTVVTGSNILDTRRYVLMINHYSGRMVRGKFKGAVNNLEANGKKLEETSGNRASRASRRQKATRTARGRLKATPTAEKTPKPSSERIIVDTPELTSAPATPAPALEASPLQSTEGSETEVPSETADLAANGITAPPELAAEQSPSPNAEEQQTAATPEPAALAANPMSTPAGIAPEQSPSPNAEEQQIAVPSETGTRMAKRMATPPSEQGAMEPDAGTTTESNPTRPDASSRSLSAPQREIPKPPRSIDEQTVARLDAVYQSAVKANDVAILDEILADDFVLVTDRGDSLTKADLIKEAQKKRTTYEELDVEKGTQKVRIWRDTAVVTGLLRIKGTKDQNPFDYKVWVSETYVRTPTGWRYVFGQPLKPDEK